MGMMETESKVKKSGTSEHCNGCGRKVGSETVVKISVEQPSDRVSTVLCTECAAVECGNCTAEVSILSAIGDDERIWSDFQLVECDRCGDATPSTESVELRHDQDPLYRRKLCGNCLKEIAVPSGYQVVRDVH